MFKRLGNTTIDNTLIYLYKRAGRMYYSLIDLGEEVEGGDIKPIIEDLKLNQFAKTL